MRGFYGYEKYLRDAEFLGCAYIEGDLRFFCSDYPVLIKRQTKGEKVKGELFQVDAETLDKLRNYEGIGSPLSFYSEKDVEVHTDSGVAAAKAFVASPGLSLPVTFASRYIPEADWRAFKESGGRFPIPKPMVLFFSACAFGAVLWEILSGYVHIPHF
jgi:gamma-glutamylcyclotransferase (GGCT)/AIG2-like uncharacterized protein YtfP